MTLDRTAILRNAQKLLRIGKLDPAIKLYEQVVRETPEDLQTAAKLGNLYVRAGSPEKAMNLFLGIADGLRSRGLHSQASVAYQRVRRELLEAERSAVVALRNEGRIADDVMQRVTRDLDLEDSRLDV